MNRKPKVQVLHLGKHRMVAYTDAAMLVPGHGYRVAFVVEGEAGYRPTGNWPYTGEVGEVMPWFWGPSLQHALDACKDYNRRLGIEPEEAFRIVARSMAMALGRKTP